MGDILKPHNIETFNKPAREILSESVIRADIWRMIKSADENKNKEELLENIHDYCLGIFQGKINEVGQIMATASALLSTNTPREFVFSVSEQIYNLACTYYSDEQKKELESNLRHYASKFVDKENLLNEMVHYDIDGRSVLIHVWPVSTLSLKEKLYLFNDGLSKLADELKKNPKLQEVDEVLAISWILAEHPNILKKWGFKYEGVFHKGKDKLKAIIQKKIQNAYGGISEEKEGIAYISKDDFVKIFNHNRK